MKKLLMGIFGLMLLLPFGVNAEEDYTPTPDIDSVEEGDNWVATTVTIATVETPVYEVYMVWENPSFNWEYNKKTGVYNWAPTSRCERFYEDDIHTIDGKRYTLEEAIADRVVYVNDACNETTQEPETIEEWYYRLSPEYYTFGIEDMSQNGRIIPSVKWTSDEKYSYVEGKFKYTEYLNTCRVIDEEIFTYISNDTFLPIYTDNSCSNKVEYESVTYQENTYYAKFENDVEKEITNGELPDSVRIPGFGGSYDYGLYEDRDLNDRRFYNINLKLENKEEPTQTPTAGDTLGTITISIRASE